MKKLVLLLCLFAVATWGDAFAQLPAVTLKTIDGQTVKIDTLNNGGKPFILDFFGIWCKPCLRELDAINEVYEEWQAETGVKIIAVSTDQAQNSQKVKPLVSNHGWEYEVLLDPNEELLKALGGQMTPYTIIVDGKGQIVYKHTGYTDGEEVELINKVRELVNQ